MRLDDVYDMTFAEFQIRLFAYKRMQIKEWEKFRFVAWCAFTGSHQDAKKMPKTIDKFMSLGEKQNNGGGITQTQKERFLEAYSEYLKQSANGKS